MPISGADKVKEQSRDQLARIAQISMDIRKAVRAALPAPAEQFFTMMVPGKVVNFDDFTVGFDAKGKLNTPLPPRATQLAEAILCDDMPALSGVQLGPTGRSVSRSYEATLSKLCPASRIGDGEDDANLSETEIRYRKAMIWLTSEDPLYPGKTRIGTYKTKQTAYTEAFERKTKAFNDALDLAIKDPRNSTVALQRAAYDTWVSENQKTYRDLIQAAYMDWVTVGKKEEVEYWFAIVDNDSAMSRVESSKEAMRAAVISDIDGAAEYQTVKLTPSNWAWLAKQKAASGPTGETAESLTWKISRLEKVNAILKALKANPKLVTPIGVSDDPAPPPGDDPIVKFLQANHDYSANYAAYQKAKDDPTGGTDEKTKLDTSFDALRTAREALTQRFAADDKRNINSLNKQAADAQNALFADNATGIQSQINGNEQIIDGYKIKLAAINKGASTEADGVVTIQNAIANEAGIPPAIPDIPATEPDYWTSIALEVSSSYSADQSKSSSSSFSVGASASWGLWSVGGSAAHSSTSSNAAKQMANSTIKVSFECMRVDIGRSWLRGELFYDDDLKAAPNNYISPGPVKLASLLDPDNYQATSPILPDDRAAELAKYDMFPMYPTSFLLAANVVLEIEGESSDIQMHFSTSSSSGSGSVGWGPFSVTSSFSHTDTQVSSTCEATANGCRITIKSPQIIGWISEIVPALPRLS